MDLVVLHRRPMCHIIRGHETFPIYVISFYAAVPENAASTAYIEACLYLHVTYLSSIVM